MRFITSCDLKFNLRDINGHSWMEFLLYLYLIYYLTCKKIKYSYIIYQFLSIYISINYLNTIYYSRYKILNDEVKKKLHT